MKRYLVFLGYTYSNGPGGIDDLIGEYDVLEEAIESIHAYLISEEIGIYIEELYDSEEEFIEEMCGSYWWHVYDCEKKEKVFEK